MRSDFQLSDRASIRQLQFYCKACNSDVARSNRLRGSNIILKSEMRKLVLIDFYNKSCWGVSLYLNRLFYYKSRVSNNGFAQPTSSHFGSTDIGGNGGNDKIISRRIILRC